MVGPGTFCKRSVAVEALITIRNNRRISWKLWFKIDTRDQAAYIQRDLPLKSKMYKRRLITLEEVKIYPLAPKSPRGSPELYHISVHSPKILLRTPRLTKKKKKSFTEPSSDDNYHSSLAAVPARVSSRPRIGGRWHSGGRTNHGAHMEENWREKKKKSSAGQLTFSPRTRFMEIKWSSTEGPESLTLAGLE